MSLKLESLLTGVLCDSPSGRDPPCTTGRPSSGPSQSPSLPGRAGGARAARDRYLWARNPPPASRRQDVSTKQPAGHGQQAFFLGLSPPSSCPFILSLPSEKAEKDRTVGRPVPRSCEAETPEGRARVLLPHGRACALQTAGRHTTSQDRW